MTTATRPRGVLLVGSVPLDNAESVFRLTSRKLGDRLRRIPDGETGMRINSVLWQGAAFRDNPALDLIPPDPGARRPFPLARLRAEVDAHDLRFANLGFADAARESYAVFARLKREGVVPPDARFEVSLPTPLGVVYVFALPEAFAQIEPAYLARLKEELAEIAAAIPHDELAIQWELVAEMILAEGMLPPGLPMDKAGMIDRVVELADAVPADIETGYHLCYGDFQHRHWKEATDSAVLVEVANALVARAHRPIQWMHLPIPRHWTEPGQFAALKDLKMPPETEVYLGLVHYTDGLEGTQRRVALAQQAVPAFGVATECGFGRRPPETVEPLMDIHAAVSEPVR